MDRRSREARYLKRLLTIVAALGFAFVCLLGAIFMLYAAQGINSVMIYSPPIGPIMEFELNLAQLGAEFLGGLLAVGVLLHQLPGISERLGRMIKD